MNAKQKILAGFAALSLIVGVTYLAFAATLFDPDAANQPVGYVGKPAVTSTNVKDGAQQIFIIDYSSDDWTGNLHSYDVSATGVLSDEENWEGGAQKVLDDRVVGTGWATRIIVTRSDDASPVGIPFQWVNLTATQKPLLDSTETILNYIRGDGSNENAAPPADGSTQTLDPAKYRYRAHKLGDIIHSTPVYCSTANCGEPTVFVGANDGMLHAFDPSSGAERFAYIPSMLLPKLKELKANDYTHKYYVDGPIAVEKFNISGTDTTILVGSLGGGGKGLYALNVTNAAPADENAAKDKILWEITATGDFAKLGHVYGSPALNDVQTAAGTKQPALVIGNGYNGTGTAVLYLIKPTDGTLIKAIDTGTGTAGSPNGLSAPSLVMSGTLYAGYPAYDLAYAGDIDGNLWKFDLVAGTATKLYTTNPVQAITVAPGVMNHPEGGIMVTFATGKLFTAADKSDASTHYAYGIWDKTGGTYPVADTALQTQTLTAIDYVDETFVVPVRWATANAMESTHLGWKTALPVTGERHVGNDAFIVNGVYQFVTFNPTVNTSAKPYGEGWWVQLNALTGGETPGDPLMDLNEDKLYNDSDRVTVGTGTDAVKHNPVARQLGGGSRSQMIRLDTSERAVYQGNVDKNDLPATTATTSTTAVVRGVSGGHFDFDIFCNPALSPVNCGYITDYPQATQEYWGVYSLSWVGTRGDAKAPTNYDGSASGAIATRYVHIHEYDDIYDRTGVNMINPSLVLDRLARMVGANVSMTKGTSSTEWGTATSDTVTKYKTGEIVQSSSSTYSLSRTSGFTTSTLSTRKMDDGYPQSSFIALANEDVEETVAERFTNTLITTTREYTDGTYYACPSRRSPNRKCYYLFIDGAKTTQTETVSRKVTYAFSGSLTEFRVLVSNQAYSPAAELTISADSPTPVKSFNFQTRSDLETDTDNFDTNFPKYTMKTLRYLKFNLPIEGFKSKDWGTGVTRAGLHPTVPDCVWGAQAKKGPEGEWRNGALTIQIVKADIQPTDIRMNVAGKPELGYVVKESSQASKLIGEYATFWHAPIHNVNEDESLSPHVNGGWCMGEKKNGVVMWNKSPPEDPHQEDNERPAAYGSADPRAGSYGSSVDAVGDCATTGACTVLTETTETTVTVKDGVKTTTSTTTTTYSDGSTSVRETVTTSDTTTSGITTEQFNMQTQKVGRVNWREFLR